MAQKSNYQVKGVANKNEESMLILDKKSYNPNLEENSNCISRFFFCYTRKIMQKGAKLQREGNYLTANDLHDCEEHCKPETQQNQILTSLFNEDPSKNIVESEPKPGALRQAYSKILKVVVGKEFIFAITLGLIGNVLQFAGPIFLKLILEYLEKDEPSDSDKMKAYIYVACIFFAFFFRTFITQNGLQRVNNYSMRVLNGTSGLLQEKILKLSSATKKYFDGGRIMNFISVDQQRVFFLCQISIFFVSAPVMIIVSMVLICLEVGWWGLLTPLVFIISLFFQSKINGFLTSLNQNIMIWKDKRAKAVEEYFSGIKIIKYYAWEKYVFSKIKSIRSQEHNYLFTNAKIRSTVDVITNVTPLFLAIAVFSGYIASGNELKSSQAYSVLAIFNLLILPVRMVIYCLMLYIGAKASMQRIDHFIDSEERKQDNLVQNKELPKGTISIENGNFNWESISTLKHSIFGKRLARGYKQPKKNQVVDSNKELSKNEKLTRDEEKEIEKMEQKDLSILKDITFKPQPGKLTGVVGKVASGKSSLLHALLGEMEKQSGTVQKNGSVAYVSQQAWLKNASLRDNILFGSPYEIQRYNETIKICELEADIEILQGGDLVEIGERGVNLSGGQKQRVALARAVYANADIYIIDDCLSALDAHVGKNIFKNVIKGKLAQKTIIFVTHAQHLLSQFDHISIMENGQIVEQGTYEELNSKPDGEFKKLTVELKKQEEEEHQGEENDSKEEKPTEQPQQQAQKTLEDIPSQPTQHQEPTEVEEVKPLNNVSKTFSVKQEEAKKKDEVNKKAGASTQKEERAVGSVPKEVYWRYFASGGSAGIYVLVFFIIAQSSRIMCDWWIGQWTDDKFNMEDWEYIVIYASFGLGVGIFFYARGLLFAHFALKIANHFSLELIDALLHTPMHWFDITPTGRIISRATKDQDDMDSNLPFTAQMAFQNLLMLVSSVILICAIMPFFIIIAIIAFYVFYKAVVYYLISAREIKRIEAVAKAPVISNFQESIQGTYIIRAFGKEQDFIDKYVDEQHRFIVSYSNYNYTQRWISVQTDIFALVIIVCASLFAVLSKEYDFFTDDPSLMGLAISWALQISTLLAFTLKMVADTESQMNSVLRLLQYINDNPQEGQWDTDNINNKNHKRKQDFEEIKDSKKQQKREQWPEIGNYSAKNITYRYREKLPNVIHGIDFDILNKEKIGIVGRTGSGKSTITLGLLRILELAKDDSEKLGTINLNSQDIANIGLHDLREKCTIIPQDPVLFTGNLRENIDPFKKYTDEEVQHVLEQVQIWEQLDKQLKEQDIKNQSQVKDPKLVQQMRQSQIHEPIPKRKLKIQVESGGENFSLGQRQLVCMARALIRKPKVLLMDEATASIDEMTDHLIQKMIKSAFKDTTVITIAHRINTIMQYDKIIVLNDGKVDDIDTPINMLNKDCLFNNLVNEGGPEFRKKMLYLAQNKDELIENV